MARPGEDQGKDLERRVRSVLLGVLVVVSLVLLGLWRADNPRLERLRMELADAVVPGLGWAAGPIEFAAGVIQDSRNFLDVYEQNRTLRREIQRLRGWRETARAREEENAQLRALMNVRLAPRLGFVTGDVIADSGGPFSESVLVNVGALDGVLDGSAAVDGTGLVGRVVGLGDNAARLLLLTDFSSRVPVVIQPSGRRAILAGDASTSPLLEFIDNPDEVKPGDAIQTSGDGGVFPPNLPVGRAVATNGTWRAALASDFRRLEFVRLLRWQPDTRVDRPGGLILRRTPEPEREPELPMGVGPEPEPEADASPRG